MRRIARLLIAFAAGVLLAGVGLAQDRALHWDSLTVHAMLDADGVLHVIERHAMVFDGPWNGGERSFHLRSRQRLQLESVIELRPSAAEARPFVLGDLDRVGEYRLMDHNVLRWRSRMPDDPPFATERRTYEIRYSMSGVLVPQEGSYLLNHDLAFPQRSGEIKTFDATLELDPSWRPVGALDTKYHRENLAPGESVLATAQLQFVGAGQPTGVVDPASIPSASAAPLLRYSLLALVISFALLHARALIARERTRGRFEPGVLLDSIDETWLRRHVFSRAPEEVGAAWDLDTSASEVSALLARLALEGKVKSEVHVQGSGFLEREILHLELLCSRSDLAEHERSLIDALFFDGGCSTDTDRVRKQYRTSGFSPASLIRKPIERRLSGIFANRPRVPAKAKWLTFAPMALGIVSIVFGGLRAPESIAVAFACAAVLIACYGICAIFSLVYRNNVLDLEARLRRALMCIGVLCLVLASILVGGWIPLLPFQYVGLALMTAGCINSSFNIMRPRDSAEALQMRRALASARKYFERELSKPAPNLKDEWFPYLLAFGLGPVVDRWFTAFGASSAAHVASRSGSGSTISTGASGSSGAWTGGGGTFGGAGATGSWASAVGGIASGVSAASSGSSSGGSGGGGSSGGGGGGGW